MAYWRAHYDIVHRLQQYWPTLKALAPIRTRPKLFSMMDYFSGGDSDLDNHLEAVDALSLLGLHGLMANFGQPEIAAKLRQNGHDIISGSSFVLGAGGSDESLGRACVSDRNSSCNFHVWDHRHATDADLINASEISRWAEATAAPFLKAGYTHPGQVSMLAQADEPGWSWDGSIPPVQSSPIVRGMWHRYLQLQGLSPADLGQATWDAVTPVGRYDYD